LDNPFIRQRRSRGTIASKRVRGAGREVEKHGEREVGWENR
jgi:hypothetical protein